MAVRIVAIVVFTHIVTLISALSFELPYGRNVE